MYEFVEHHIDEHGEEDERVCPRPVGDELLHDWSFPPSLPDGGAELSHGEHKENGLERERDDPSNKRVSGTRSARDRCDRTNSTERLLD